MDGIDWAKVNNSFSAYFANLGEKEQCHVVFDGNEIYVFTFEDIKFENEDNWEVEV